MRQEAAAAHWFSDSGTTPTSSASAAPSSSSQHVYDAFSVEDLIRGGDCDQCVIVRAKEWSYTGSKQT